MRDRKAKLMLAAMLDIIQVTSTTASMRLEANMKTFVVLALSIFSLCASAKEASPAVVETYGVNSDYAMPLVSIKRIQNTQELDGGILKDLGMALFKELHLTPQFILLPKKESRQI